MKLRKGLFMLCAGLSLCACSSDDGNQFPEGNGEVIVKIVPPTVSSRTPVEPTSTNTVQITGTYTITLTAASGVQEKTFTESEWTTNNFEHTFTNVTNPIKVQVSVNGGENTYTASNDNITTLQQTPTNIPAYGETETFVKGDPVQDGNKSTITYTANVQMAIPVARLEIGNITFNTNGTLFEGLTVGGVYLDKLRDNGSNYSNSQFVSQGTATLDYQFGTSENEFGKGKKYILGDIVEKNFIGTDQVTALPSTTTVYAYNFFGATPNASDVANNPIFKIYFSSSKLSSEASPIARYAMITKYKSSQNGEAITLENGKIYKIIGAELSDKNIINDEENNTQYQVEVTVQEAQWSVHPTFADWAQ